MSPPDEARRAEVFGEIRQAIQAGDMDAARRLAAAALDEGFEHPQLLNLRALDHEAHGRFEKALADLRRAHLLAPKDFAILNACGLCLGRLQRIEEAVQCFKQALEIEPAFGPAWFNSAWALEQLGEVAKAADAYAKAVEISPENVQAWANLAWLAARRGDEAATRQYADRAFALQPDHPTAVLALANVELAEPLVAERRLRKLLNEPRLGAYDRSVALGQLGDVLDAQDRPAEAFAAYEQGNALMQEEAAPRFEVGPLSVAGALAWMIPWAQALDRRSWFVDRPTAASAAGAAGHVFLVGFPRSGTTLMESALAAHPHVVSLEERNTLQAGVRAFLGDARSASRLTTIREADLKPYRDDYWAFVKSQGVDPAGKIFIDKNPFNTLKLPLIYRLFPNAKIIFAIRDPRDVMLSCFRRRFNLNASTYELLDLRRGAAFYDSTMRFADVLRGKKPMAEHALVYERLVEDFAREMRATCAFIGAEWREDLADFAGRARRGEVASASSAQISRGLYADGAGQWRRYRDQLAPVLPVLAPWVEQFGYPAE